ncbi:unnamed protein product, partial [Ectocarpus sp. 12 AP-2014]
ISIRLRPFFAPASPRTPAIVPSPALSYIVSCLDPFVPTDFSRHGRSSPFYVGLACRFFRSIPPTIFPQIPPTGRTRNTTPCVWKPSTSPPRSTTRVGWNR